MAGGFGHLIELEDQTIATGYCFSASHNFATGVSFIDQTGEVVYSNCRAIDTMLVLIGLKKYSSNEFVFTSAYYKDTCEVVGSTVVKKIYPVIGRMDGTGNVIDAHYYSFDLGGCQNFIGEFELLADQSVVSWGGGGNFFAFRVDSAMQPVWVKRFGNHGSYRFIKELPDGDLVAGINMDTAGVVVTRMDAMGNVMWAKSYFQPKGMVHDAIIESDGSIVIVGYTDSTSTFNPVPMGYHPKLFMLKLNGNGDVQWCKGYDSGQNIWQIREALHINKCSGGNYVLLANIGPTGSSLYRNPFLMRTDLNGDTIWTRSAGVGGYSYTTSELLTYSDGGFLFSGYVYGDLPQNMSGAPYIFKADSMGHLPCSEEWYPIQVENLFPNDSSVTLTSSGGATVHPAFFNDTIFDPITSFDGCIITSVQYSKRVTKFRVRPNPNTGHFTMVFDDPLIVDTYYSVFDAMGRLLYQRPLPTGATTEEIDLSRFGKGTYTMKVTDKDKVRVERVVVQ